MKHPRRPARRLAFGGAAALAIAATACSPGPSPFAPGTPTLVVLLVVDQMSQEYLDRLQPSLRGGLGYLLENGVVFADAHHNHANTVTGAGHATLASGCYPRRSGIIGNEWRDRRTGATVYCVADPDYGRSPANLMVDTLGDWIKDLDAASKVFALGGKDRSAILLGGHQADAAFWYDDRDGSWTTSDYYAAPEWLETFNDRRLLDQHFGTLWEPLWVPDEALGTMDLVEIDEGAYPRRFPHAIGGRTLAPSRSFYEDIYATPFADRYTADLALTILDEEQLGSDAHPDVLGIAFHALDSVGHDYGPHSRETIDTILRLDITLGEVLDAIDDRVGLEQVVVALSSDHGVAPVPEARVAGGGWGARAGATEVACFQNVGRSLRDRYGDYEWLKAGLYLDNERIERAGLDRDEVLREVADLLGECPFVEKVWTAPELAEPSAMTWSAAEDSEGESWQLFHNSYHPERSPDFALQYAPYYLNQTSRGTSHGTPHRYDTWVPLIVAAADYEPARIEGRAHTADLAPTLAEILGFNAPGARDGQSLVPRMRAGER